MFGSSYIVRLLNRHYFVFQLNFIFAVCAELRDLLSLFLLRRQKEGVFTGERALPDKCELLLFHGLTGLQKSLYKALLMKNLSAPVFTIAQSISDHTVRVYTSIR